MRAVRRHFRQSVEPRLGGRFQEVGVAAGIAEDVAGEVFEVLDQGFQKMFGEQVLMAQGQGLHLRGLQQGARTFGEIREVHERHSVPNVPAL